MAESSNPVRPTVFPPAVWRRVAEESESDEEFIADMMERVKLDNDADAAIRLELLVLARELYDLLMDRAERVLALSRLVPEASEVSEVLACAGLAWDDTGIPASLSLDGAWLPKDLSQARMLLAWLEAHPSRLPIA